MDQAWNKLARLAGRAANDSADMPYGFNIRVVAAWKASSSSEGFLAALERLTWRGLAVAVLIFGSCAALGYDSFMSALSGEAMQAGDMLSEWFGL